MSDIIKYNAENPPESLYIHFHKTAINIAEKDDYLPVTIKYIKVTTEPMVALSEVLELLQDHRLKYGTGDKINVATDIIDIFKEKLKQKYGAINDK